MSSKITLIIDILIASRIRRIVKENDEWIKILTIINN